MSSTTLFPIPGLLLGSLFAFDLSGQTVIDFGKFEDDVRISNYLPSAGFGRSAAAGDVNGDGIDDMLIGAGTIELFHLGGGGAFLIFGNQALPRFIDLENPQGRVAFWGGGRQDYAGDWVDVFDFSNDGLADVFIAAPQWNFAGGNQMEGRLYFFKGRAHWPAEITLQDYPGDSLAATLHGERSRAYLGYFSTRGDYNGDGVQDLATVTRFANRPAHISQQSTAYLLWGGQRLITGKIDNPALQHCTITPSREKQISLILYTGNLDGDAYDDLIVNLPDADVLTELDWGGVGFILWGRKDWPETLDLNGWQTDGQITRLVGRSQVPMTAYRFVSGDFNGNGITDMVIDSFDTLTHKSYARLYLDPHLARGKTFEYFDPRHQVTVIVDPYARDGGNTSPYKMIKLDWNHDGVDDLALTNLLATRRIPELTYEGNAYVLYGAPAFPDTVDFRRTNARWDVIWGGTRSAWLGQSIAAGDVDGDRKDDLIIGAWSATTKAGEASGEAYVLLNPTRAQHMPAPGTLALLPASPNPLRANCVIWFDLNRETGVQVQIYDVLGRRVRLLLETKLQPGRQSAVWNGRDQAGNLAKSGVYFIVLRAGNNVQTQKILLLR